MPRTRKAPKPKDRFIDHVLDTSAEMYTFDAGHRIWTMDDVNDLPDDFENCFVRLYPPIGTAPSDVDTLKRWLMDDCGASAVKVMATPVEAVPDAPEPTVAQPERPIRQVVMERADRTQGVRDQSALADLLTQCMDKAGL